MNKETAFKENLTTILKMVVEEAESTEELKVPKWKVVSLLVTLFVLPLLVQVVGIACGKPDVGYLMFLPDLLIIAYLIIKKQIKMSMKRINGISIYTLVCGTMLISGCSNPYDRAEEVKKELGKSAYVVSEIHAGEAPELVTAQRIKEKGSEVYRVSIHNLNDGSTETLNCGFKPVEVLKNTEGYLVISEYVHLDTPKRKSYCVESVSREGSSTTIWLDEEDEMATPTAYVVDKRAKQIILTGFSIIDEKAKEYYVKIDFEGQKVAEDTKTLALKPSRKAMYLWVCSNCGVTRNNTEMPYVYYPHCRKKPDGTNMAHNFSNHGRVD